MKDDCLLILNGITLRVLSRFETEVLFGLKRLLFEKELLISLRKVLGLKKTKSDNLLEHVVLFNVFTVWVRVSLKCSFSVSLK